MQGVSRLMWFDQVIDVPWGQAILCLEGCQQYLIFHSLLIGNQCSLGVMWFWHLLLMPIHSYGVFITQVLSYANACMEYRGFVVHSRNLTAKLRNKCYSREMLIKTFRKFSSKYMDKLQIFDILNGSIIEDHCSQLPYTVICGPWTEYLYSH